MAKKKRTAIEELAHSKAVKMRKMTDEQLCDFVREEKEKSYEDGKKQGKKSGVKGFLETIKMGKVPGIGTCTLNKLLEAAKDHGHI